jgi:hypothetical protein
MSERKWIPPDNFYEGYSLYQHFGYGPEGEYNLTLNLLQKEGYPTDNILVKETLELTKELVYKIQELCETEIQEYAKMSKTNLLVGGTVPFPVLIAKAIIKRLLEWGAGKTKSLINKLTTSEEERILNRAIEKLQTDEETNEIILKSRTTYEKTYTIRKKNSSVKA